MTAQDDVLEERLRSLRDLLDERWRAHTISHEVLAAALAEYKAISNEWQRSFATFASFRGEYVTTVEWKAEYRALVARIDAAERAIASNTTEQATARNIFSNARNLILLLIAILGVGITLAVYLGRA